MGNDLTKGTTYVDGMMLNAANLNAHVDDAVLKSTAISARTAKTAGAVTDEYLINDSGTLKKITGTVLYDMVTQTGAVIQSTYGIYTASAALSAVIPFDDTIPQISEGTEIISLSFTPRFANSKMVLRFIGTYATTTAANMMVAIFRDSGVDAIASMVGSVTAGFVLQACLLATHLPATTSTITYTVRAGPGSAGSLRFNGTASARLMGGTMTTTLEVQEVRMP